tara:strand:+ start:16681 stop:18114 length:1434 start_codon:yes stop_codon:yes gene_type:complete
MPFNSISFLVFFVLIATIYYLAKNLEIRTFLLIAGSWFFYGYDNIFNLLHILFATFITLFFANKLTKKGNNKLILAVGISILLLQLILTKYHSELGHLFSIIAHPNNQFFDYAILPIGISFYSLQAISLLVDIRNKKYTERISFKNVLLFLNFFPQSISGPIHRANDLIPQFSKEKKFQTDNIIIGLKTVLWGYFCKLIIADKISIIITPIFNSFHDYNGLPLFLASLLFSFQIYFDFWGYSLIAIGLGKILGFTINVNFNNPYSAGSFKIFWHKWHITLSKWMRDYVYIPLGGRNTNMYFLFFCSITITFLVSGFWHGIATNFIIWGGIHALLYLIEDLARRHVINGLKIHLHPYFRSVLGLMQIILFFVLISFTWLIFKTEDFADVVQIMSNIFSFSNWSLESLKKFYSLVNITYLFIILASLVVAHTKLLQRKMGLVAISTADKITDSFYIFFCFILIVLLGDIGGNEFLYFKF